MPKILQTSKVQISWDDIHARGLAPNPERKLVPARTPGVHLSGVLRYIGIVQKYIKGVDPVTGKWTGDADAELLESDMPLRMVLGMAFEEWISSLYPDMNWQPGELLLDGVTGSPDGITWDESLDAAVIEEFKCTWKSSRQGILDHKNIMWLWQGGCYAHMYGTRFVRFNILWVNGNYDWKGADTGPQYVRYLLEYSQAELDNYWRMIILNRDAPGVKVE